jgi:hypothetical protein
MYILDLKLTYLVGRDFYMTLMHECEKFAYFFS